MKKYTPKDALPLPTPITGKGFFSRLLLPDDGDKRAAAIYGAALEAAANALEWIRHRLVNGLEGGVYDGPLSFTNVQTLGSHKPKIDVTSGLDIDGDVDQFGVLNVYGNGGFSGNLGVDGEILAVGNVGSAFGNVSGVEGNFESVTAAEITAAETMTTRHLQFYGIVGATMTGFLNDSTTRTRTGKWSITGGTTRSGAGAWDGKRLATTGPGIPSAGAIVTISGEQFDTIIAPALTQSGSWKLAAPTDAGAGVEVTVVRSSGGALAHRLTILSNDGTAIGHFAESNSIHRSITFAWNGTAWFAKSWARYNVADATAGNPGPGCVSL